MAMQQGKPGKNAQTKEDKAMTRDQRMDWLQRRATARGFRAGQNLGRVWVDGGDDSYYANITVCESIDSWAEGKRTGHFEISASVRRMGGTPTVEELKRAAYEIREAAEFMEEMNREDLSFEDKI